MGCMDRAAADGGPTGRPIARSYLRALLAWWLVGILPSIAAVAVIAAYTASTCGDAADCSWGLEYLMVVPVTVACFVVFAPLAFVSVLLSPSSPSRSRVRTAATWSGIGSIGLLSLSAGSGSRAFFVMLAVVALGVPAVVTWIART